MNFKRTLPFKSLPCSRQGGRAVWGGSVVSEGSWFTAETLGCGPDPDDAAHNNTALCLVESGQALSLRE